MRALTVVLPVLAAMTVAGCAKHDLTFVPDGVYSGSTSTDR